MLIPSANEKDLVDIPANIKKDLEIHPVKWIDQVLDLALESAPKPLAVNTEAVEIVAAGDANPEQAVTH